MGMIRRRHGIHSGFCYHTPSSPLVQATGGVVYLRLGSRQLLLQVAYLSVQCGESVLHGGPVPIECKESVRVPKHHTFTAWTSRAVGLIAREDALVNAVEAHFAITALVYTGQDTRGIRATVDAFADRTAGVTVADERHGDSKDRHKKNGYNRLVG